MIVHLKPNRPSGLPICPRNPSPAARRLGVAAVSRPRPVSCGTGGGLRRQLELREYPRIIPKSSFTEVYPELAALVGTRVPDLRGLFLRGIGGKAGNLGQVQTESIHIPNLPFEIPGISLAPTDGMSASSYCHNHCASIAEGQMELSMCIRQCIGNNTSSSQSMLTTGGSFQGTINISTGQNETRPQNMAVRYLIKAQK
jgi:hypothetical protein